MRPQHLWYKFHKQFQYLIYSPFSTRRMFSIRNFLTKCSYPMFGTMSLWPKVPQLPSHHIFLLATQWHHILGGCGEQPHGLSGGFVVSIMEDQGLLHCEKGNCPVPYIRAGHPSAELALQFWAEPHCSVCALPLQNHHLTHAEQKQRETTD